MSYFKLFFDKDRIILIIFLLLLSIGLLSAFTGECIRDLFGSGEIPAPYKSLNDQIGIILPTIYPLAQLLFFLYGIILIAFRIKPHRVHYTLISLIGFSIPGKTIDALPEM